MSRRYYIDLDVLSRLFDEAKTEKVARQKALSAEIHKLISDGKIDCISSEPLKREAELIPHPIKRGWLFDLFKKPGFSRCVWTTQKIKELRDKLAAKCGFPVEDLVDALHITIAAAASAERFLTFNEKHFIHGGRKKCIENFFKKEISHAIEIIVPKDASTL